LEQNYRNTDILVIADTSNDAVRHCLQKHTAFLDVLHHDQPNQAVAFNIAVTRFHPSQFYLVPSGTLASDFVAREMQRLAEHPDEQAVLTENAFLISRPLTHRVGLMDEWLTSQNLGRYWFRMARVGVANMDKVCFAECCRGNFATIAPVERSELITVALLNLADSLNCEHLWLSIPRWWEMLAALCDFPIAHSKYVMRASVDYLAAVRDAAQGSHIPLLLNLIALREGAERVRSLPRVQEVEQVLLKALRRELLAENPEVVYRDAPDLGHSRLLPGSPVTEG
jgi:hypothetical protein